MRTLFNPRWQNQILGRLRRLDPDLSPRWGRMTAPQMVAHLSDQMRHTLGDVECTPKKSRLGWPLLRLAAIYFLPWPKARIEGPPDAFQSRPKEWDDDLKTLELLVERFGSSSSRASWPPHAMFGPMTARMWGRFCYRHFDHHLRQFGH